MPVSRLERRAGKTIGGLKPKKVVEPKRGAPGPRGPRGLDGSGTGGGGVGWSPLFGVVSDGQRRVLQVTGWFGGHGNAPPSGDYIGVSGLVGDIADAVDIRASDYEVQSVTADGDLSIGRSVSKHCVITLNGDVTSFEITGWPPAGLLGNLTLEVHNAGSFLISVWPDGTIWDGGFAPTPSPLGVDIYLLFSCDGGATIFGSIAGQVISDRFELRTAAVGGPRPKVICRNGLGFVLPGRSRSTPPSPKLGI